MGNSATHGTWHHLKSYHLKSYHLNDLNDHYEPELRNISIQPQLIEGTTFMYLLSAKEYINFISPNIESLKVLEEIIEWIKEMGIKCESLYFK